ncbi:glycosyltransferase family 2 protein [Patescibacteria group bacterium]|nr:glycosyltransferase family 2 protein [Patescibacteria group bacterium]
MKDPSVKIAVIILSYNGQKYFPELFASLKAQTLPAQEIVIVDNNSQDDSVPYIQENFPEATLIISEKNLGFAGGNNLGIKKALENKPGYIFMLNQDTVCDPRCLEILAKKSQGEDNLFAAQPLINCWPPEDQLIQTSGNRLHFLGFGYSGDYKNKAESEVIKKIDQEPAYLSGAALFIKSSVLEKTGLLDEDLFLYHEDTDLCWRAKFLGYSLKVFPEALVYHKYTEAISRNRWFWSERNRPLFLLKFFKIPTLILILPCFFLMELGILFYSLLDGWFITKVKSIFSSGGQFFKTLKKRRQIQKSRQFKDRELINKLDSYFDFAGFEHPLIKYIVNPIFGFYWKIVHFFIFW